VHALLWTGFINAQRGLDETTHKDINLIGKILESLLTSAMCDCADAGDRDIAQRLKEAVEGIQDEIRDGFNKQVQGLFPTFSVFGYPGLSDPHLLTETTLDVERLLKNHTKVHYGSVHGINLPEPYNGLGVRNLIFILLKLLEFFKSFAAAEIAPGIHLIFIEEPEVHLHPQMQEVFISNIGSIAAVFAREFHSAHHWPVQFVITTHSSHVANRARFESIRYFLATRADHEEGTFVTRVKDLRTGLAPTVSSGVSPEDREFLHKYMTLTRCDLLFADKAVLIEGTAERLVLPKMIEKIDTQNARGVHLSSQYVSVVEVGGAYAHRFFRLLEFLELRTLVITDLDAVKKNESGHYVACTVSEGTRSSNEGIKKWFAKGIAKEGENGEIATSPVDLINRADEEKTHGVCRIAYQVPETPDAPCGRTFEDAFILANMSLFGLTETSKEKAEMAAWYSAARVKKSDFAVEYAIEKTNWSVPRYIADGLRWLSEDGDGHAPSTMSVSSCDGLMAEGNDSREEGELHG
jgi:putative ATP-dependent endonuclease of the OLD family